MFHEPVVHEKILFPVSFPGVLGDAYETIDGNDSRFAINREQFCINRFPEGINDTLSQAGCWQVVYFVPVVDERERDIRGGEGHS